ncbi:alpha/beta fold hydrolase [Gracilibacillus phocaeensis]|uniref:alpha/beta fold hydrolase n=1 Tax=Gracilibacillus phocaeensis TaxID=2042304 RepID=UPI001030B74E|nr:alpha/beta hydrolase [Gracilibacillus phocaeensis]
MDLHYEVAGSGQPVILLHSGGADLRDWTFIAPLLAKHYMVVSYDGRGAGKSPDPTGDVNCVEDLKALLDHLQIHKAVLVGHSMGGQVATDFSLEYPEYVSALIVIAPALTGFDYSADFLDYMNNINAVAPNVEKMMEVSQSAASYRVVQASPHKELVDEMLRHHIKRTFQWPGFELIWPAPPAVKRLNELVVNTLFIIGTEELLDNLRVADYFRKETNARIVDISGADHMVPLTHSEDLYRHITEFLED